MKQFLLLLFFSTLLVACTNVSSGHRGAEVSWGGKTNMSKVYEEGIYYGFHWFWDDMEEYDCREKTINESFEFNDKNNMLTPVGIALDCRLDPTKVNVIHSTIGRDQLAVKIITTLESASKQVIPQYSASELNLTKREEAERQLLEIVKRDMPAFYVLPSRVRLTKVSIPKQIADAAEATAKQQELNKLSESKVIQAKNNLDAAEFDAKTKAILSQPAMIELQRVENERLMWEGFKTHGKSPYGENNVFGAGGTNLLLNRK